MVGRDATIQYLIIRMLVHAAVETLRKQQQPEYAYLLSLGKDFFTLGERVGGFSGDRALLEAAAAASGHRSSGRSCVEWSKGRGPSSGQQGSDGDGKLHLLYSNIMVVLWEK